MLYFTISPTRSKLQEQRDFALIATGPSEPRTLLAQSRHSLALVEEMDGVVVKVYIGKMEIQMEEMS